MLKAKRVEEILMDCLFNAEPTPDDPEFVKVEGITTNFGLRKSKLTEHKDEIHALVKELPPPFMEGSDGDGWSFLNMCVDKHGVQWGEQRDCQNLYVLAAGCGLGRFLLPREAWYILPGNVPYIAFKETA